MARETGIEWTDATWNPIRGCSRVSEGCRHCYAENIAYRFSDEGMPYHGLVGIGGKWNGEIRFVEEHLLDPLKWKKPQRIFVNSMSDLFHEKVTDEMLDRIFAVMALCPQHTFQVLTKRPERMRAYLSDDMHQMSAMMTEDVLFGQLTNGAGTMGHRWPLPNVWLGVSVENQKAADERIPLLLQTPAAVRFLSVEPLLGPVDLQRIVLKPAEFPERGQPPVSMRALTGWHGGADRPQPTGIDWVIVGGESGPGARPMHPDWARSLRDQCKAAGVPFFFKQWGEWLPAMSDGALLSDGSQTLNCCDEPVRVGKKAAGHLLDGIEHHGFPAVTA